MKKLLMMAAVLLSTIVAKAEDNISASLKVTSDKNQATVHVNLDNTSTFVAFQFDIAFPASMEYNKESVSITQSQSRLVNGGKIDLSNVGGSSEESTDFVIVYNWITNNTIRVIGYNLGNEAIKLNQGEILAITVNTTTAVTSADQWTATFNTSDFVTKEQLDEVVIKIKDNEEQQVVGEEDNVLLGDANNDGQVNVLDAILVLKYKLTGDDASQLPTPINLVNADVDQNGVIDVLDVIVIMKM